MVAWIAPLLHTLLHLGRAASHEWARGDDEVPVSKRNPGARRAAAVVGGVLVLGSLGLYLAGMLGDTDSLVLLPFAGVVLILPVGLCLLFWGRGWR
jgi:hypothetical protein